MQLFFFLFAFWDTKSMCFFLPFSNLSPNFVGTGKTYFFKGKGYWEFNDYYMRVAHERQKSSAQRWMGCKVKGGHENDLPNRRREPLISDGNAETDYEYEEGITSNSTQLRNHWHKYTFLIYVVLASTITKFSFF